MDAQVANTKSPLWKCIANPRDAQPELDNLRLQLSRNPAVASALEDFLYSYYHYLLGAQRFAADNTMRDSDIMTANAVATIAQLVFEDRQQHKSGTNVQIRY